MEACLQESAGLTCLQNGWAGKMFCNAKMMNFVKKY